MDTLIPLLIAGAAALAIVLIAVGLAGQSSVDPVQARLTQLGTMQAKNLEELELQAPFFERTIRPLAGRLSGTAGRFTSTSFTSKTEKNLALAGNPGDLRVPEWLGMKVISAIAFSIIIFLVAFFLLGTGPLVALVLGVVGVAFGYLVPEFWLGRRVRSRQHAIVLQIPDALDLLTISVRAGLGFDAALGKVVEKMQGPLSTSSGAPSPRSASARPAATPSATSSRGPRCRPCTNFIGAVIQAEQLGVAISKVLQVQSEQLRIERRQRAEEMAAKAPIKMLFPLVGCIFPSLFIVILGPAIILIVKTLVIENAAGGG